MSDIDTAIFMEMDDSAISDGAVIPTRTAARIATRVRDEAVTILTEERDAYRELAKALDSHLSHPGISSAKAIGAAEKMVKEATT